MFDFQVGETIPDQIIKSVNLSRRTLIVLSKAYVDSMWTNLELRAAHTQVAFKSSPLSIPL